jgi:hypothetical protein
MQPTAEELAAALAEQHAADPAPPESINSDEPPKPAAPAPAGASAAEIAAAVASAVAAQFGTTRIEGTPAPAQRQKKPTTREMVAAMSPEQRAELENRLLTGGAAAAAEFYEMIARDELSAFEERAAPMVASTGALLVDSFMTKKSLSDRYYAQIAPLFTKRIAGVDRGALVGLNEASRNMQLDTMWEAAAAEMFRKAATTAPPTPRPPVIGGSGGGGGSTPTSGGPKPRTKIFEQGDGLQQLAEALKRRTLPDGTPYFTDADLAWAEANYEDSIY